MAYYVIKVLISAAIIVAVTELAKRSAGIAALVASLPLTSLLAFAWLKYESGTNQQLASLSIQIFWLVIPSLLFFVAFWWLLTHRNSFAVSIAVSTAATVALYLALLPVLRKLGVNL